MKLADSNSEYGVGCSECGESSFDGAIVEFELPHYPYSFNSACLLFRLCRACLIKAELLSRTGLK
jgi:hypothetical protein